MSVDDYALSRDYLASVRLNLQHHLWSENFGYMMHPAIPCDKIDLAIADIGTGTGIWLLEVSRHLLSPSPLLYGLDISGDQFPRLEWLPPNIKFLELDALDPEGPPADMAEAFDIVHIRLFIAIVKNNDPTVLLDYCYKLLKQGGYLQWDEHEASMNRVGSHKGSPTEGMSMLEKITRSKDSNWIPSLPNIFSKRGFEVINVDSRIVLPWHRGWFVDNYCMLADEFVRRAEKGGKDIYPVDDFYKQVSAKASVEKSMGSYMDQTLQIVVGRKT